MSKQKILTIVGVALLVIMVIVAFGFKGKYDDASSLLIAAQADAADQKKAADTQIEELNKQLAEAQEQLAALQTEADTFKTTIDELTASKEAAEKQAAELEEKGKELSAALALEVRAVQAAKEEAESAAAALIESQASLKDMTTLYNQTKADLDAKITRYNIVRESHAKLAEKYDQLAAELEALTAEEVEYAESERYESKCGVSFVLPEGASIGSESSKMVEILLPDGASIRINMSTGRANILWFDAEIEAVNQLAATLVIN